MKIVSIFNNKGGVGKTTLLYNTAHALSLIGKRVLVVDCDPQCNLSLNFLSSIDLENIWEIEDRYIEESFQEQRDVHPADYQDIVSQPRSLHFILRPTEEGIDDAPLPKPYIIKDNLHLIPGRLTMYYYENTISRRWNDLYQGDSLAIRTVTKIRNLCENLNNSHEYDITLIDTSPSLGALNKVIISLSDHFIIPCNPDKFSLYGIKNIGNSLSGWLNEIIRIRSMLSTIKQNLFPKQLVTFIGYCLYKAKKYDGNLNDLGISQGHYNVYREILPFIRKYIKCIDTTISQSSIDTLLGEKSVIYADNTHPSLSQQLLVPMWKIPEEIGKCTSEELFATKEEYISQRTSINGNRKIYEDKESMYKKFASSLIERLGQADNGSE